MVGEVAGQTWLTQMCSEGELVNVWLRPLSTRSSTPTPGRISHAFQGRSWTWNPSGPCSKHSLLKWLPGVVAGRSPVPVMTAAKEPIGGEAVKEAIRPFGLGWPRGLLKQQTGTGLHLLWLQKEKPVCGRSSDKLWTRAFGWPIGSSGKLLDDSRGESRAWLRLSSAVEENC